MDNAIARCRIGVFLVALLVLPSCALAQGVPPTMRGFLSLYTGKEILLVNRSSDSLQFVDCDSAQRYVVVLDEIRDDVFVVHRSTENDRREFEYPLADIRRITYLFGSMPYARIVVETF